MLVSNNTWTQGHIGMMKTGQRFFFFFTEKGYACFPCCHCDGNMSRILLCVLTLTYFNVIQNRMICQLSDKPILSTHMSNVTKKEQYKSMENELDNNTTGKLVIQIP